MPYKTLDDANTALKVIRPKLSLEQANDIANAADAIEEENPGKGWAFAIAAFKKGHTVRAGKWVTREQAKKGTKEMKYQTTDKPLGESMPEASIPFGIKSFAALKAIKQNEELTETLADAVDDFMGMVQNILYDAGETDKLSAIKNLFGEFTTVAGGILGGNAQETQPAETVTVVIPEFAPIAESYEGAVMLEELTEDSAKPMYLDVQIIRPGWGNTRDNNFYHRDMLRTHAEKFVGAKMYESDHNQAEKSTRTWVSTIESIKGFTDDGAPIARVAVHDNGFADRMKNLSAAKMLDKMECSILANGSTKPYEADGRKGKIVESIHDVSSVDWVTRAGAGGKVLNVSENEPVTPPVITETTPVEIVPVVVQETPVIPIPTEPPCMEAGAVLAELNKKNLPAVSRERLSKMQWKNANELTEAVDSEIAYIKELMGSGRPSNLGGSPVKPVTLAEINKRQDEIIRKALGG